MRKSIELAKLTVRDREEPADHRVIIRIGNQSPYVSDIRRGSKDLYVRMFAWLNYQAIHFRSIGKIL
jgi:hypothetical protein